MDDRPLAAVCVYARLTLGTGSTADKKTPWQPEGHQGGRGSEKFVEVDRGKGVRRRGFLADPPKDFVPVEDGIAVMGSTRSIFPGRRVAEGVDVGVRHRPSVGTGEVLDGKHGIVSKGWHRLSDRRHRTNGRPDEVRRVCVRRYLPCTRPARRILPARIEPLSGPCFPYGKQKSGCLPLRSSGAVDSGFGRDSPR